MSLLQMQKCIQLDAKLKEMDSEIAVNPQYVQKVCFKHVHISDNKNYDFTDPGYLSITLCGKPSQKLCF